MGLSWSTGQTTTTNPEAFGLATGAARRPGSRAPGTQRLILSARRSAGSIASAIRMKRDNALFVLQLLPLCLKPPDALVRGWVAAEGPGGQILTGAPETSNGRSRPRTRRFHPPFQGTSVTWTGLPVGL